MPHIFDAEHAALLDDPDRKRWQKAKPILKKVGVKRGQVIVEIGAGTGYFTIPASEIVGGKGMVYAIDIQKKMIKILEKKISEKKIENIKPILIESQKIPVEDESADLVLIANTLHEIEDRDAMMGEVKRILKRGEMLAIVEWRKIDMEFGPPFEERLSEEETKEILVQNGFCAEALLNVGPHHYAIRARKKAL